MKKHVFKMLLLLGVIAIIHAACGGSDDSTSPEATNPDTVEYTTDDDSADQTADDPTNDLPEIVDKYNDDIFRYVDHSLYAGSYDIYADFPDTCSDFFGVEMQDTLVIPYVSDNYLNVNLDGTHTFYAAYEYELGDIDAIGYKGSYRSEACAIVLGSVNETGRTYDLASLACVKADLSDDCGIGYYKPSTYDFSHVYIKDTGSSNSSDVMEDLTDEALRLLSPSL